jgi:hypothetical protein
MPTTILEQTKTHPPRRGLGNRGQDAWEFDIASGQQLSAVELAVEAAGPGCGARIASAPNAGTVGHGRAEISWWHSLGQQVRYRIKVTTEPLQSPTDPTRAVRALESTRFVHGPYSLLGTSGFDEVVVALPPGFALESVDIVIVRSTRGLARFRQGNPRPGSTGSVRFFVEWEAGNFGGLIEYFLRVTAVAAGPIAFSGSAPTFSPANGIGGSPLTVSVRLTNIGTVTVSSFMLKGDFYARSLDDVPQSILDSLTEEQRTSRQADRVSTTIAPFDTRTLSATRTLPARIGPIPGTAGQIFNPSTKGDYDVTVTVEAITTDASGNEMRTQVYSQSAPFKIIA